MTSLPVALSSGRFSPPTRPPRSGIRLRTPCRRSTAARTALAPPPQPHHFEAEPKPVHQFAAAGAAAAAPPPPEAAPATPRLPVFGDALLEASRVELRTVFDQERWREHRSCNRYFRHMLSIGESRVLLGLAAPLAYVLGICAAVCAYGAAQQAGLLPPVLPSLAGFARWRDLYNMTSPTLALLLVFRTNASYARWDEARKMWGMVLNRTRDIVRLGLAWIGDEQRELRAMLCRWAPAYSKCLMCHLRKGEDLRRELEGVLLPHEIQGVLSAKHRPIYVLQVLAQIVQSAGLPNAATLRMEENITSFEDSLGGCERLLRTPIPLFYTRHTSRFLMIWLTFLPATLYPACGLLTLPLAFLISFLLLGVDKIGVSIEEPFSILELETIASRALDNARELASMHDCVAAIPLAGCGNSGSGANGNGHYRLHTSFGVHSSNGSDVRMHPSFSNNGSSVNGHVSSNVVSAATMVALARRAAAA